MRLLKWIVNLLLMLFIYLPASLMLIGLLYLMELGEYKPKGNLRSKQF